MNSTDKIASVNELMQIPAEDNQEPLVELCPGNRLKIGYQRGAEDMGKILQGKIFVRKTVADMLAKAALWLTIENPQWKLFVTYGYRSPKVQTSYFLEQLELLVREQPESPSMEVFKESHRRCAYPPVGGHVAGGAIDITIWDVAAQREVDMGCSISEYGPLSYFGASGIPSQVRRNRQILRDVMEKVGFVPFDGEWWHFSYGDREWAWMKKEPAAIYGPVELERLVN